MENRGSNLILTNLVEVYGRNIHIKFEADLRSSLREEAKNVILHVHSDIK